MKKLLAILLSMLMLCTMIPFATVYASEGGTVEIEIAEEEVDAGDEIEVTVNLANNPGVIAAMVEVLYDHDAFELVATWDEDDEAWMYPITIGATFKASSNKFITFGPMDDETGIMKKCSVLYVRGDATSNCTKELFFTATFKVKDDAVTGDYSFSIAELVPGNFRNMDKEIVPFTAGDDVTVHVNGTDPEPEEPVCQHEYEYDCSKNCKLCGKETRPEAEHQYFCACDPVCMICYEMTNPEAAHSMKHVEAKPATCTQNGNIAYWTCEHCGGCWDNENAIGMPLNQMMVIVPASCKYGAEHVEAKPATCTTEGNVEYWYCANCDVYYADADCTVITNAKNVILPASCKYDAVYTAAKPASCTETGNVEYWYCANCDVYYADAACTVITNAKSVIIPTTPHTYDDIYDVDCNVCGAIRTIESTVITSVGASIRENDYGTGLAFRFDVDGSRTEFVTYDKLDESTEEEGDVIPSVMYVDYNKSFVTPNNDDTYKLIGMGAKVNNGKMTQYVHARKVLDLSTENPYFFVRILDIPDNHLDTEISAVPYYVYENAAGQQIIVYGDMIIASYNSVAQNAD